MDTIFNVELHFTYVNKDKAFWVYPCATFEMAIKAANSIIKQEIEENGEFHDVCAKIGFITEENELPIVFTNDANETMEIYICEDKIISNDEDVDNFVIY